MNSWIESDSPEPSDALVVAVGHRMLARILIRRGFATPTAAAAFLDPDAYTPASPCELPDLAAAAERLRDSIRRGERVLIWGDFDVDGQTSAALLMHALNQAGARARTYIPHRLHEGHGIKLSSLKAQLPGVDVLLTCDTGVGEHKAIAHAGRQGVSVLITDHHDLPPELPPAEAVVNPKRLPIQHPLRELPGVGVAFKVVQEVYRSSGQSEGLDDAYLDLVALGIVADVATQVGDTRYLLQRGMQRLRQTERVGLQALIQNANVRPENLSTDHIGFALGPRLNAAGRLGDANHAVELLTTDDLSRARILAAQLEGLNDQRRVLTDQIYAAAQEQIARDPALLDVSALVLSGTRWHPGVIGIVAGRLAETYGRPAVVISEGEDGLGRGSARSVPGVDIHAAISAVEGLLLSHGGHPGAAGLSLPSERIAEFRRELCREIEAVWDQRIRPGISIDAMLPWQDPSLDLVETLNMMAPFGEGNPPVVLASRNLEVVTQQTFGRDRAHRRLAIRDACGITREVVWWRGADHASPTGLFDLAYTLKASDYLGVPSLQIEYVDARAIAATPVVLEAPAMGVVDHRAALEPFRILEDLRAGGDVAIWAEGYPTDRSPGSRRDELQPSPALVVWNPPPGPREMREVLERVEPRTVYFFNVTGEHTRSDRFFPRLAGLIKHTLLHGSGFVDLAQLAAVAGQRVETVRKGICLLEARGDVQIAEDHDATMRLIPGTGEPNTEVSAIQDRLHSLLQETAAYRAFFARAPAERLI